MDRSIAVLLTERFDDLEDPRTGRAKRHDLIDIATIAICAVVCGADSWVDVETYGGSKEEWLGELLDLPNGIPSHDTFGRVFAMLDPAQFEACFRRWVDAVNDAMGGQVVAIDGRTARGSHDRSAGKSAIHTVSAWASANHLILGQTKVDDKSNEITAIPELLDELNVSGCTVTIDAMGCQKEIARKIIERDADYALALKRNQRSLYDDVRGFFETDALSEVSHDFFETVEKGHGRIETRRCWAISDPEYIAYADERGEWAKLTSVAKVEAERTLNGVTARQDRYCISSLPNDARRLLADVRAHWGIENSVHWVLDVAFREDDSRVRVGCAAENFSILRRMALNLIKREKTSKGGVAARRKRAGWDDDCLLTILAQ